MSDIVDRLYDMIVRLDIGSRVLFGEEDVAIIRDAIGEVYELRSEVRSLMSFSDDGMV